MKTFLVLLLLGVVVTGWSQESPRPVRKVAGTPTGACTTTARALDTTNNLDYFCGNDLAWHASGTVTVSTGALTSTALITGGGTTTVQAPSASTTLDTSGNLILGGTITTGGSGAGSVEFSQGTAQTIGANSVGFQAPTSVSSAFYFTLPGAPAAGLLHATNATPSVISVSSDIAAATATSLLATGIVDGKAPVDVTTSSPVTLGGTYKSGYTINEHATAGTAITYNLPTAAAGLQYCVGNGYNGSAANTGVITLATSAAGQYLIWTDGTLSATGGNTTSGGAGGDFACVVGVDSTHWMFLHPQGTWTKH